MPRRSNKTTNTEDKLTVSVPVSTDLFKVGDFVLCNLQLTFQDNFNPWTVKGTILSMFTAGENRWAKVLWGEGYLSHYLLNKGELLPFSEDILKKRKLDVKAQKSKSIPESTQPLTVD